MSPARNKRIVLTAGLLAISILCAGLAGCPRSKATDDPKDLSVLNTDPYQGETGWFLNDRIVITMSAWIDVTTADQNTILITDPNGAVPQGRFEVHYNELHFIPQYPPGLSPQTTYTVTLQGWPMTPTLMSAEGTPLMSTYSFFFDTGTAIRPDTQPPYVVSCNISNGQTNVPRDTNIVITFNEPLATSSVSSNFTLTEMGTTSTPVNGTITMTSNATILNFDPENGSFPGYLNANTQYEIRLTSSITDVQGLLLGVPPGSPPATPPFLIFFNTGDSPTAATPHGPFIEDFTTNNNEDSANGDAEWNTQVPTNLVSRVFPSSTQVVDPGPTGNAISLAQPFSGVTGHRMACIVLASELAAVLGGSLTQIANKPISRLFVKSDTGNPITGASYTNLVVRLGHTTNNAFPQTVSNFSQLYVQGPNVVTPQVVCRLSNFTVNAASGPGSDYFEIPIDPTFIFSGNAGDNLIIDIEVGSATTANPMAGDSQATNPAAAFRRAWRTNPGANYDLVGTYDINVPIFTIDFGGALGSDGLDGGGNSLTTVSSPFGTGNDFHVTSGGTLDTSSPAYGYGHMKFNTLTVDAGASVLITPGSGTANNPAILRVGRTVRIDGRILCDGAIGVNAPSANLSGGAGGRGGPGGGPGGTGGAGTANANGQGTAGNAGTGLDGQATNANGGGSGGQGGTGGGGGGGGGGYGGVGTAGHPSGAAQGGAGGNSFGSINLVSLCGGGGGGGGGGGVNTSGALAGGGGAGGGGGYIQITTDRNMYFGANSQISARGGRGGGAAVLGQGGGGGGGAGGAIYLQALSMNFTGTGVVINAQGGLAGRASAGGGNGAPMTGAPFNEVLADGRIRIDANTQNQVNATMTPNQASGLLIIRPGTSLGGQYLSASAAIYRSTGQSLYFDTTCSAPQYTTAEVRFSDTATVTAVYVNFEGADPNILAQPFASPTLLYQTTQQLPSGVNPAVIDLNTGSINGGVPPANVQSLNGLRFIRFIIELETTSATTTAQVNQVTIRYQY